MALDREALMVALADRLKAACPELKDVSRHLRTWGDVSASEQPIAFMVGGTQAPAYTAAHPPVWTISARLFVYARNDANPDLPPGAALAYLLESIEAALERKPEDSIGQGYVPNGHNTTLGGLCQRARIAGTIETDEGALGDQLVAVLTIEMLAGG